MTTEPGSPDGAAGRARQPPGGQPAKTRKDARRATLAAQENADAETLRKAGTLPLPAPPPLTRQQPAPATAPCPARHVLAGYARHLGEALGLPGLRGGTRAWAEAELVSAVAGLTLPEAELLALADDPGYGTWLRQARISRNMLRNLSRGRPPPGAARRALAGYVQHVSETLGLPGAQDPALRARAEYDLAFAIALLAMPEPELRILAGGGVPGAYISTARARQDALREHADQRAGHGGREGPRPRRPRPTGPAPPPGPSGWDDGVLDRLFPRDIRNLLEQAAAPSPRPGPVAEPET